MGKKIPPTNPVSWQHFGYFLFQQREADPGYYIVTYLRMSKKYSEDQLFRFCVAWCAFYNLGLAANASELEGHEFYEYLRRVYPTAIRASERRHFRGAAGLKALTEWEAQWQYPEDLARYILCVEESDLARTEHTPLSMGEIRARCANVPQMGDYFKWKWGDLGEVLLQEPVRFRGWENVSPKVPQEGAALIAAEAGKPHLTTEQVYRSIVKQMQKLGVVSYYAPWRKFDVQDAETICCVYKQYRSGSYRPGIRTAKAYARLTNCGNSETALHAAKLLLQYQPQRKFQSPAILGSILEGETIYTVEDLCELPS